MIELSKLSPEGRLDIVRGSQTFFLTYKTPKWQDKAVQQLENEFGKQYNKSIKVILTCVAKALRYESSSSQFSLDRNVFAEANKITKQNISYNKTKTLIDKMELSGYLTLCKGYHNSSQDSMMSCLLFDEKLLGMLDKSICKTCASSKLEGLQFVEVVDEINSTKRKKYFLTNSKFKGINDITKEVKLVNKVLEKSVITYRGSVCSVVYKRRFHSCIKQGGRWYIIGTFQTEDSQYRYSIEIDGEASTEIDFKFIHPSIFATIEGITLSEDYDPYNIKHLLKTKLSEKEVRSLCKTSMMALLYASNRGTALYEIRKLLQDNNVKDITEKDVLEALEEHNYFLHKYFYTKDNWKLAQFIDSQIATQIMLHFSKKGQVCLCYHDSFIVKKDFQEELITVMKESWNKVLGNTNNFKYEVEF